MINLNCPMCGTPGLVKHWTAMFGTGEIRPWCFCPRCRHRWHAKFLDKITQRELEDTKVWVENKDPEQIAKYIHTLEKLLENSHG